MSRAAGTPSLRGLFALSTGLTLGYGSVFTLLGAIRETFGFSNAEIGWITGSGFLAGLVAQVGLARFADRGYGTAMVRAGVVLAAVGALAMAYASTVEHWIGARVLLGVGAGCVTPGVRRMALTADPARAGANIGLLSAYEMVGFLLGPLVASLLFGLGGLRAPFIGLCVILVALLPIALRARVAPSEAPSRGPVLRTLIVRGDFQASLAAGIAFYITVGVFEAVWALFMTDLGAGQLFIGVTMSLFTAPMIFIAPRGGALAQQHGPLRIATWSIGVAIACMLLYGVVDSLWWILLPLAIHAVADSFTMPANQIAVAKASGEANLAAGQGLFGAMGLAVAALAAIVGGAFYEAVGPSGVWILSAVSMAAFLAVARLRAGDSLVSGRASGAVSSSSAGG